MKVMVIKIKHSVEEYLNKHCVRSVRIQSYSGLDFLCVFYECGKNADQIIFKYGLFLRSEN